jgi:plasmid stability protein
MPRIDATSNNRNQLQVVPGLNEWQLARRRAQALQAGDVEGRFASDHPYVSGAYNIPMEMLEAAQELGVRRPLKKLGVTDAVEALPESLSRRFPNSAIAEYAGPAIGAAYEGAKEVLLDPMMVAGAAVKGAKYLPKVARGLGELGEGLRSANMLMGEAGAVMPKVGSGLVPLVRSPKSIDEEFRIYQQAKERADAFAKSLRAEGLKNAEATDPRLAQARLADLQAISGHLGSRPTRGLENRVAAVTGADNGVTQALHALPASNPELVMDLVDAVMSNKKGSKRIVEGALRGKELGADKWYDTSTLLQSMGPARRDELMFSLGPTSQQTTLGANISKGSLLDFLSKSKEGMSFEELAHAANQMASESPDAGDVRYLLNMNSRDFTDKRAAFGDLPFSKDKLGPAWKTPAYVGGLQGNKANVAADTHVLNALVSAATHGKGEGEVRDILRKFLTTGPEGKLNAATANDIERGIKTGKPGKVVGLHPTGSHYTAAQLVMSDLARKAGMTPRDFQSSAWVGLGDETGLQSTRKNFEDYFMDFVNSAAAREKTKPGEVLKQIRDRGKFLY